MNCEPPTARLLRYVRNAILLAASIALIALLAVTQRDATSTDTAPVVATLGLVCGSAACIGVGLVYFLMWALARLSAKIDDKENRR
jgi:hypothetical protein